MNPDDAKVLVSYRVNQAEAALNDAKVLLDSDCTPALTEDLKKLTSSRGDAGNAELSTEINGINVL